MTEPSSRCPACGADFTGDTNVCTYCGKGLRFAGLGHAAKATALPCPRCGEGATLNEVVYRNVTIDVCPRCEGSWYDLGELETLVRAAREDAAQGRFEASSPPSGSAAIRSATDDVLDPAYIRCPHCDTVMNRQNWEGRSGVIVDWCASHGIWLDGGELQRVRGWAARTADGAPRRSTIPSDKPLPRVRPSAAGATLGGVGPSHGVGEVLIEVLGDVVWSIRSLFDR